MSTELVLWDFVLILRGWMEKNGFRGWVGQTSGRLGCITVLLPWSAYAEPRKDGEGKPVTGVTEDYKPYVDFRTAFPPDLIQDHEWPVLGGHEGGTCPFYLETRNQQDQRIFEVRQGEHVWVAKDWTTNSAITSLPTNVQPLVRFGEQLIHGEHKVHLHQMPLRAVVEPAAISSAPARLMLVKSA